MSIGKPTADWNGVLRVEDVGCRGIVNYNRLSKVAPNLREIFDVIALMVVTTLAEETVVHHMMNV